MGQLGRIRHGSAGATGRNDVTQIARDASRRCISSGDGAARTRRYIVGPGGTPMRTTTVLVLCCVIAAACSEASTANPSSSVSGSPLFARGGSVGGSDFITVSETGVDATLPGGQCFFRPDGSGEFNNFLRTSSSGTRTLKIQDATGTVRT